MDIDISRHIPNCNKTKCKRCCVPITEDRGICNECGIKNPANRYMRCVSCDDAISLNDIPLCDTCDKRCYLDEFECINCINIDMRIFGCFECDYNFSQKLKDYKLKIGANDKEYREQKEIERQIKNRRKKYEHVPAPTIYIDVGVDLDKYDIKSNVVILDGNPIIKTDNLKSTSSHVLFAMLYKQQMCIDKLQATVDGLIDRIDFAPIEGSEIFDEASQRFEQNLSHFTKS